MSPRAMISEERLQGVPLPPLELFGLNLVDARAYRSRCSTCLTQSESGVGSHGRVRS